MQRSAGEPHFSHGRDSDFRCAQKSLAVQGTVSKNLCCSFKISCPHQSYIPHRSETGCRPWLPNKRSSPKDQSGAFGGLAQFPAWTVTRSVAPRFVGFEAWAPLLLRSGDFSHLHLRSPRFVHHNWSRFTVSILTIAAPWPLVRFKHQASLNRIAVNVAQLLDALLLGEDDEVLEASLPEVAAFERAAPQRKLLRMVSVAASAKASAGRIPA